MGSVHIQRTKLWRPQECLATQTALFWTSKEWLEYCILGTFVTPILGDVHSDELQFCFLLVHFLGTLIPPRPLPWMQQFLHRRRCVSNIAHDFLRQMHMDHSGTPNAMPEPAFGRPQRRPMKLTPSKSPLKIPGHRWVGVAKWRSKWVSLLVHRIPYIYTYIYINIYIYKNINIYIYIYSVILS